MAAPFLRRLSILASLLAFGLKPKADALTFSQLQEGAEVMATAKRDTNITPMQRESVVAFTNYCEGFFTIAFQAQNLSPENRPNPLYQPQEWMGEPKKVAASVLNFLVRHKPETIENGDSVSARKIFLAWYLYNSKNRDESAGIVILTCLRSSFGPAFPGSEELAKELTRAKLNDE